MTTATTAPLAMIISQPKAASTSLMTTLGSYLGVSAGQQMLPNIGGNEQRLYDVCNKVIRKLSPWSLNPTSSSPRTFRELYPAIEFPALSLAHSDFCDLGLMKDSEICFRYQLHKQHFPPTPGNVKLLGGIPKIILTRDPEGTVASYLRVDRYSHFKVLLGDSFFRQRVLDELEAFSQGWIGQAEKTSLKISHEELTTNPQATLSRCMQFLGAEVPAGMELHLRSERRPTPKSVSEGISMDADE